MIKLFYLSAFILFISFNVNGAKSDTVYFQNNNKILGEVKIMENNLLEFSTDNAGKIKIEWDKIDSIYIKKRMRIVHSDGRVLFGTIKPTNTKKIALLIMDDMSKMELKHINIIRITPDEIKFRTRIDGKVSAGFSYTKASDLARLDISGNLIYWHNMNQIEMDYFILTEKGNDLNQKQNGGLQYIRLLPKKWFLFNRIFAESNSELNLQLRTNYALGGGHNLIYSNYSILYVAGGLLTNREEISDTATYNLEGIVTLKFSMFRYSSPKLSFDIKGTIFPSINDIGRFRTSLETTLSWEMFDDFYLKWSMYHSFDSQPLVSSDPVSDYAISLLGLEFKF